MKLTHNEFTVTPKDRLLIQKYLEHYYQKFAEENTKPLSFKNQMQLLHDYVTHLEVDN